MKKEFVSLVKGKKIAFVLHGHTLKELDDNIDKFKETDCVWGSLNQFDIAEKVLSKAGIKLDFVCLFPTEHKQRSFDGVVLSEAQARGGSLQEFLLQCSESGVTSEIYLFGAEGVPDTELIYYGSDYKNKHNINSKIKDVEKVNQELKDFGLKVYNVGSKSSYTCFEKITVEEALKKLKKVKKIGRRSPSSNDKNVKAVKNDVGLSK